MADRLWTDADRELVASAYHWAHSRRCEPGNCPGVMECCYAEDLFMGGFSAVLDALVAAGWRPARDYLPAAVEALDRHAARVREQEWERVAAEIDDEAARWPGESRDFHAGLRRAAAVARHMAARIDTTPEAGDE